MSVSFVIIYCSRKMAYQIKSVVHRMAVVGIGDQISLNELGEWSLVYASVNNKHLPTVSVH